MTTDDDLKLHQKKTPPQLVSVSDQTLNVAALQDRAAMKNSQIYVKREFSKLVGTPTMVTVGLEIHIFSQVQLAFNF